ncbi:Surfactin synthase thioesterase subunit [Actinomadura meyerae]|jgi:surfactin synthase thioesterase subunit|uniref:Surfactin synthase thioesterase subunit n=1 Tax=Actinomadura meyerae TaxID=240840 RepID=A0A239NFV5_9ACTN|nr:alpha/beta fold hydrolase [Actinomadura meyerae]SNT53650.1 Surfactin synthase thioesterase subunit [Actinomadura meyerae]
MSAADRWLRRFHPAPDARVRLVCFPHAGGSASAFHWLSERLAPQVEVLAVQYPGRQDRRHEPLVDDVLALARSAYETVAGLGGEPPALFGHSMGATLAYEVARLLEHEAGVRPRALFVSGRRAPSRIRPERVRFGDDEALVAELNRLSGTDLRVLGDEEMRRLVLPVVRADYTAIERYRRPPGPDPTCPLWVLAGDADPLTTLDEAGDWERHTTAGATLRVFPGGHFFIDRHQREIGDLVAGALTVRTG